MSILNIPFKVVVNVFEKCTVDLSHAMTCFMAAFFYPEFFELGKMQGAE